MDAESACDVCHLVRDDIPRAMELVAAASWNQTPRDWFRLLEYEPYGCFKAVANGRMVGTVTSTRYESELAWIGMMLVDAALQRRGIGTQLMRHVIDYLESVCVQTIKLDATPAGRPMYERLGFVAEHDFQRWSRPALSAVDSTQYHHQQRHSALNDSRPAFDRDDLRELDLAAFGVNRFRYLQRLASDSQVVRTDAGFGMLRPGRFASYLGPVIASSAQAAQEILSQLIGGVSEQLIWDVPHGNQAATALAAKYDFQPVRTLTRMWRGTALVPQRLDIQFAISDPSTG